MRNSDVLEAMGCTLQKSGADYAEIRIQERQATEVRYRGHRLESAYTTLDRGGIVRCFCHRSGWGIAVFSDLCDLEAQIDRAIQCARAARDRTPSLYSRDPIQDVVPALQERDVRGVSMAEKQRLLETYNEGMFKHHDRIVDTRARYRDAFSRTYLASTDGTLIQQERPVVEVSLAAIARRGDEIQVSGVSRAGTGGFEFALGLRQLATTAAQRSVDLLDAKPVTSGRYPVILNPQLAGVLVHEAFGHLVESDTACDSADTQRMALGTRVGPNELNVFDDGSLPGLRGTQRYDDEGTPTGRSDLIRDGVLVGHLHSRETAAKLGKAPTGNARATSYRQPPTARMTNTAVAEGNVAFQDMVRDIDLGIYACDSLGGQTTSDQFAFCPAYAFVIRHGQIAERVRDVVLEGNVFETLSSVDAIGDDFAWSPAGGLCVKEHSRLPVGLGAPHVRVRDMLVGSG